MRGRVAVSHDNSAFVGKSADRRQLSVRKRRGLRKYEYAGRSALKLSRLQLRICDKPVGDVHVVEKLAPCRACGQERIVPPLYLRRMDRSLRIVYQCLRRFIKRTEKSTSAVNEEAERRVQFLYLFRQCVVRLQDVDAVEIRNSEIPETERVVPDPALDIRSACAISVPRLDQRTAEGTHDFGEIVHIVRRRHPYRLREKPHVHPRIAVRRLGAGHVERRTGQSGFYRFTDRLEISAVGYLHETAVIGPSRPTTVSGMFLSHLFGGERNHIIPGCERSSPGPVQRRQAAVHPLQPFAFGGKSLFGKAEIERRSPFG